MLYIRIRRRLLWPLRLLEVVLRNPGRRVRVEWLVGLWRLLLPLLRLRLPWREHSHGLDKTG